MADRSRKVDLLFMDMDGTLTGVRSPWEYLHRRLGLWEGNGDRHLKAWLAGEIDYDEFFRRDVEMWIGMDRERMLGMLDEIPIRDGVPEALRAQGDRVVLLPHLGSATEETRGAMAEMVVEDVLEALAGRRPERSLT